MLTKVQLPKAFSVRDDHEFFPMQHLMARLNPGLMVKQVATGMHVEGGGTVFWGIVYSATICPASSKSKLPCARQASISNTKPFIPRNLSGTSRKQAGAGTNCGELVPALRSTLTSPLETRYHECSFPPPRRDGSRLVFSLPCRPYLPGAAFTQPVAPAAKAAGVEPLYHESLRPQFHFTARYWEDHDLEPGNDGREGWINDVNGPIYFDGETTSSASGGGIAGCTP